MHKREISVELDKYSDILDLTRTKIHFSGRGYYIGGSLPFISFSLYLKPENNNRETLIAIRDGLITFFNNNLKRRGYGFACGITINFLLEEAGETQYLYNLSRLFSSDKIWLELWYPLIKPINGFTEFNHTLYFGKPLTGRTIHNEELDALLGKYFNSLGFERFDAYHSGRDNITMWFIIQGDYNQGKVFSAIRNDFINFFENNRQELIEEYGQYDAIHISFYRIKDGYPREVYYMHYERNEWKWNEIIL
jgi:hypothetical protein